MGADREYYYDFANLDGVGAAADIVLRDRDGDGIVDYGQELPSAAVASDGAYFREGYGSQEIDEDYTKVG